MAPPEPVAMAFPAAADAHSHFAAMTNMLAPCEQLDRPAHRGGRARSHGRRLGEARPVGVGGPSGKVSRRPDGAPQLRNRTAMLRGGCSVPAPCEKVSAAPCATRPSGRRPGVTRPSTRSEVVGAKAVPQPANTATDALKAALSTLMSGVEPIDDPYCEDDQEVTGPAEEWENCLRHDLLEGAIGTQADDHFCEDDLDVTGPEAWETQLGSLLVGAFDGAVLGAERLSSEDNVDVLDDEDLVVDLQLEQTAEERAKEPVNPEDVDGILVKIFRKAMTSLREELCDEFGMDVGLEAFSDLDVDEEADYATGEVFSIASDEVPELDEMEVTHSTSEPDVLHRSLERELGVEAATLAQEALHSALSRFRRENALRALDLAEDDIPSEVDDTECMQVEATTILDRDTQALSAKVGAALEQALCLEAAHLDQSAKTPTVLEDDTLSLSSETEQVFDSDSEDCPAARPLMDDFILEEAAELAAEESCERSVEVGFCLEEQEVPSDDEFEELEQDIEELHARLQHALAMETSLLADEASAAGSPGKMAFLQDLHELRARANEALLGFEAADMVEEALDEAGGWGARVDASMPDLTDVEEPEQDSFADLEERMEVFEREAEDWRATCDGKLGRELRAEAAGLVEEEVLERAEFDMLAPPDQLSAALQLSSQEEVHDAPELFCELAAVEPPLEEEPSDLLPVDLQVLDLEALEQAFQTESATLFAVEASERQRYQARRVDSRADMSGVEVPVEEGDFDDSVSLDVTASLATSLELALSMEAAELSQEISTALTLTCLKVPAAKPRSRQVPAGISATLTSTPATPSSSSRRHSHVGEASAVSPSQMDGLRGRKPSSTSLGADSGETTSPLSSPQSGMVRTPSAAGRLRPHLRESIISFRMDSDDESEEVQNQREPSITGLYETLGADMHCLDDPRLSSRAASPAGIMQSPTSLGCARYPRTASPARLSAPRSAVAAPFVLSPEPLAAPFVLSPQKTRSRGLAPVLSIADEMLKKSAKTRSASMGALRDVESQVMSAVKLHRNTQDRLMRRVSSRVGF